MSDGDVAVGSCWACGVVFRFDPALVPSVRVDVESGMPCDLVDTPRWRTVLEPVCPECMLRVVARRVELGQPSEWTASGWA